MSENLSKLQGSSAKTEVKWGLHPKLGYPFRAKKSQVETEDGQITTVIKKIIPAQNDMEVRTKPIKDVAFLIFMFKFSCVSGVSLISQFDRRK